MVQREGYEETVAKLAAHLREEVKKAQASLSNGLAEANSVLKELRTKRERRRSQEHA